MIDTYRHKGLRKQLAEEVRSKGIQDERIIQAIQKVPRHFFLDSSFMEFAYQDKAFPIGSGQTISQPYTVAFQTQLLEVGKGDKVLEIGTGSGYQACILVELGVKVFSIERQRELYVKTSDLLRTMNYHPKLFYGDGYKGLPAFAPFDRVLITAAAPQIPQALLRQLRIGGFMVVPIGADKTQVMMKITRVDEDSYEQEEFGEFRFVPMLTKRAK
ncbi:MAG: protein-L-isoaspartate(D-aspartate) O-methyltransferase [Bacteroidales bacterium]